MLNAIRRVFGSGKPKGPERPEILPLQINEVTIASGGRLGMCACPGRALFRSANRDRGALLAADLDAIAEWGAHGIVTLLQPEELVRYAISSIPEDAKARGLFWMNLPIRDMCPPEPAFEAVWTEAGNELRGRLAAGESVVFHCLAGLGRTGTIVARLLVELGYDTNRAIMAVRDARPGAIQTPAQEAHVRELRPAFDPRRVR